MKAYDFSIEYVQTDHFGHADVLSRLINAQQSAEEDTVVASITLERDIQYSLVSAISSIHPLTHIDIARATQESDILKCVIHYLQNGWLHKNQINDELAPFFGRQESLSTSGDCLMFGKYATDSTRTTLASAA